MRSFEYIPSIALFIYCFMLMVLLAARRNRIANSFIVLLISMICWTGGSVFMRKLFWPGYEMWFHVSMLGLFFLPYGYYRFISAFVGKENVVTKFVYLFIYSGCFFINLFTEFFIAPPELVRSADDISFVYHLNWHLAIPIIIPTISFIHVLLLIFQTGRSTRVLRRQFGPIILGIGILLLGHAILMIPAFAGIPIDIIAGVINACLILYALVKRRLFQLQLLASEGLCYGVGLLLNFVFYFNLAPYFNVFLEKRFPNAFSYYSLIFATCFLITTMLLAYIWRAVMKNVFVKEEIQQAEYLKTFSDTVSKSLRVKDIMEAIITVTQKVTESDAVYICLPDLKDGSFRAAYSDKPLSDLNFELVKDNPLVRYLNKSSEGVLMREFKMTISYRSMWENEKKILSNLKIVACIGLHDGEQLVGILMLSERKGRKNIDRGHLNMMNSVGSVASIALKNARLYEQAFYEARTDELTGLLNRKYFSEILNEEFNKNKESSMALVIINIDDFKLYNQLYGTKQGDAAIKSIAEIIRASVGESGYVARYTGKEFAILLPKYDIYAAKGLTDSIREQIYNMNRGSKDYKLKRLTISAGISATPYAAKTVKELLDNVDMAVYHVKRHGKNGVQIFDTIVEYDNRSSDNDRNKTEVYHEYESTIYALTAAIDAKDHYTFKHSNNVAYYATELAKVMKMNPEIVEMVRQAALLHDVGKIAIPEDILNKPGHLTEEEYEIIKGHVESSIGIIRHLPSLDYVIPAVIGHHERYDGKGYPRRIAGEDIPVAARILCIADSFDAMTSIRCYKKAMPLSRVLEILREEEGRQFDPQLACVFAECIRNGTIRVISNE